MPEKTNPQPQVRVNSLRPRPGPSSAQWFVSWRIQNLSQWPLQVLSSHLPLDRFRSQEQERPTPAKLLSGEDFILERLVACQEPPGTIIDNAFLILRVIYQDQLWRIFIRLLITFAADGAPENTGRVVAVHPVGYSQ